MNGTLSVVIFQEKQTDYNFSFERKTIEVNGTSLFTLISLLESMLAGGVIDGYEITKMKGETEDGTEQEND